MLTEKQLKTNELIGELTGRIDDIQRQEKILLEYVDDHPTLDAEQRKYLETQGGVTVDLLNENAALFKEILAAKDDGHLRFLDAKPFRLSILRLNAALSRAWNALSDKARHAD